MTLKKFKKISKKESLFFDMLRGGSAIVVFLGHIYQLLIQPNFNHETITHIIYSASGLAVVVFFYLSGLMITFSIYKNASNYDFKDFGIKKYILDRLYRLYPPLLIATFIVIVVYSITILFNVKIQTGATGYLARTDFCLDSGFWGSLFFLQNIFRDSIKTPSMNGPLWSLSHEFWFYVLAACLSCAYCFQGKIKIIPIVIFIIFTILMLSVGNAVMFFMGFGVWLLGALTAIIRQNVRLRMPYIFITISIIFFLLYFFCEISHNNTLHYYAKYVFGISLFFYIITYFTCNKNSHYGIIRTAIVKSSSYSYTLYVIHWPVLMLIYGFFGDYMYYNSINTLIICLLSFVFVMYMSWVISRLVENKAYFKKPFIFF